MASFNKCTVVGFLGRDPEIKYSPQGTAICSFSVATTEKRKDRDGEAQDITTWFSCVAFGRQAEVINEHFHKGSPIYLEGRICLEEWTDREGGKRFTLKMTVTAFEFIGKAGDRNDSTDTDRSSAKAAAFEAQKPGRDPKRETIPIDDGWDVPF
jgi:single-strand DNA-binding protein